MDPPPPGAGARRAGRPGEPAQWDGVGSAGGCMERLWVSRWAWSQRGVVAASATEMHFLKEKWILEAGSPIPNCRRGHTLSEVCRGTLFHAFLLATVFPEIPDVQ